MMDVVIILFLCYSPKKDKINSVTSSPTDLNPLVLSDCSNLYSLFQVI